MALEQSILKSTKKILGLGDDNDAFDLDVITHINTAFFTLNQLGIGPAAGFMIEDDSTEWEEFTEGNLNLNSVKTYIHLRVRLLFDPPAATHHLNGLEEQRKELEHRLLLERGLATWTTPDIGSFP